VNATNLDLGEAVALLHPLVARMAECSDIRMLLIKGPIAVRQQLRLERPSVDVDVLVDPSRFEDMQQLLRDNGWRIEVPCTGPHIMPFHSKAYRHDNWPCEIDVHDRFPGFLADPQVVFEALWSLRTTATIAGHEVPCPDLLGHAAIVALHALRDPLFERSQQDLAYMAETLNERLDGTQKRELSELAAATGAVDTLRPFLDAVGAQRLGDGSARTDDLQAWQIRTSSSGVKSVSYLYQLHRTPLRRLFPFLWHALVLTEGEIRDAQPDATPGTWGLFKARLWRLRWGLSHVPRAARIVWQGERGRLHGNQARSKAVRA
jgi:hypothetical protein